MKITVSNTGNGGNNFKAPAGSHIARCVEMIEIGTIKKEFQGKIKELQEVRISWELPNETRIFKEGESEKPYIVSRDFTLSLYEGSNLRSLLESWRGRGFTDEELKGFDLVKLLGVPCMLTIIDEKKGDKVYSKVAAASPLPKGFNCPEQINKSICLCYDDFNFEIFNTLPRFIKEKMEGSKEFIAISDKVHGKIEEEKMAAQDDVDILPF